MSFTDYEKSVLILPMDGANNGTTFTDWSPNPKTVTRNGDAKTVTAQSKYYGSSGYFDGTGDYLSIANHTDFAFGTGDFTIAFWVYPISGQPHEFPALLGKQVDAAGQYIVYMSKNTSVCSLKTNGTTAWAIGALGMNAWNYLYFGVASGRLYGGVNGSVTDIGAFTYNMTNSGALTVSGRTDGNHFFLGYLQDLLIIKGAALWTSDFEPPERLIGSVSGIIQDEVGAGVQRNLWVIPRTYPTRVFGGTSNPTTGEYLINSPAVESDVIALYSGADVRNDLVKRAIPG